MNKITADHLARAACVYIRQSTPDQVRHNLESQRRQSGLVDRARALGWQDVDVIDDDLGVSGSGTRRPGFERLLRALCNGQVGAVFSIEASRLARNGRDWHTLLEFCSVVGALLIDTETGYDPRLTNDRFLLGMKGTISEMELASFRERAQGALRQKAERGALVRRVPIGYVKGSEDRIEKDPDARVASTIDLIFRKFAELGSVRQVFFWLDQQQIQLPVARGPEAVREIVWQPARYHGVLSVLNNPVYAGAYAQGRSKTMVRLVDGQKRVRRQRQRRREDWTVLILDHHEGYIDWDAYQSNQTMIAHNDNARGAAVRGSVKHGEALLAGLLRCGHCGAKLLALSTEAQLATELAALQPNRERLLTDAPKREILVFARDLPGLWDDPRSSPEHKKRLLRIALKEIMVTSEEETIRLVLHGEGGDHTQVEFPKIRSGRHRYVTDDDLVEIVRMLARIEPDARIASILNRNRRRTAHGQSWTAKRVCSLRNNHAVPVYREGERQARAEMSASEAAAILGVTPTTVLRLIQHEQLPATQPCVGAPWILRRADVEQCLAERSQSASPPTGDSKQLTLEIP